MNKPNQTSEHTKSFNLNGNKITNKVKIANEFNIYFSSIGKSLASKCPTVNNLSNPNNNERITQSIFIKPIDKPEILNIVRNMKNKLSSGPDKISPKLLKATLLSIIDPLTHMLNESLSEYIAPDAMKLAKVIPIYKNNDAEQFSNYRPISMLSTFSKILKRAVHNRAFNFLKPHKLLYKSQYGFRVNHSTVHALIEIQNIIILFFKLNAFSIIDTVNRFTIN